jgi:hypothetical protein
MARKKLLPISIVTLIVCAAIVYPGFFQRQGPDSPSLSAFKAFLQNPTPPARIVFSQRSPGQPMAFLGTLNTNGYELTIVDQRGVVRSCGLFNNIPWSRHSNGLEVLEFYHGFPPNVRQMTNDTGGFAFGERPLFQTLNLGLPPLKAGTLVWNGNSFQAISKQNLPITGSISRFNRNGLPKKLTYRVGTDPEVHLRLEYGNPKVPEFLPSTIRRPLPWKMSFLSRRLFANLDTTITEWTLGSSVELTNPTTQFKSAHHLDYTNNQWMEVKGNDLIPIPAQ